MRQKTPKFKLALYMNIDTHYNTKVNKTLKARAGLIFPREIFMAEMTITSCFFVNWSF